MASLIPTPEVTQQANVAPANNGVGSTIPNTPVATNTPTTIPTGGGFPSSTPPATGAITSSSITPQAPITPVQPNTPAIPSVPLAPVTPALTETPSQSKESDLSTQIAALNTSLEGRSAAQTAAEAAQGLPALNQTVKDLTARATALSDQANAIPLIDQNNAAGRGITAGGLAPLDSANLRNNAIEALSVHSLLAAAQGNVTYAQSLADKAVAAQFDPITEKLTALTANLKLIQNDPQTTIEEKNQAQAQLDNVAQQQAQIDNQKQDASIGQAMAIAALKLNPNDAAAQFAAQQAMKISPNDPNYLQKVTELVGKYQQDPVATQQALANLAKTRAETAKVVSDAQASSVTGDTTNFDPNSQSILAQTGLSVAAFNFLTVGTTALSRMSSSDRQRIMKEAQNFLNKNGIDYSTFQSQYKAYNEVLQKNIARANQTQIMANEVAGTADSFISSLSPQDLKPDPLASVHIGDGGLTNLRAGVIADIALGKQVNSPMAIKYATQIKFMANDLAGYLAAARGSSQPELQDINDAASIISNGLSTGSVQAFKDTILANEKKVTGVVNQAADSTQKQVWSLFGVGNKFQSKTTSDIQPTDTSKGTVWNRSDGKYVSDGTQWVKQ